MYFIQNNYHTNNKTTCLKKINKYMFIKTTLTVISERGLFLSKKLYISVIHEPVSTTYYVSTYFLPLKDLYFQFVSL